MALHPETGSVVSCRWLIDSIFSGLLVCTINNTLHLHLLTFKHNMSISALIGIALISYRLVIKNKNTKEQVAKWINKKEPHNLILSEGTYELCQEAVDDKYILNTKCVEFNIDKNKINSENIENKLSNSIANAIATSNLSAYLIAIFLFSLSGGIIAYSFKVNKISVKQ